MLELSIIYVALFLKCFFMFPLLLEADLNTCFCLCVCLKRKYDIPYHEGAVLVICNCSSSVLQSSIPALTPKWVLQSITWPQNWVNFLATKGGPSLLPKATALPDFGTRVLDHEVAQFGRSGRMIRQHD